MNPDVESAQATLAAAIHQVLTQCQDLASLSQGCVTVLCNTLPIQMACLWLADEANTELVPQASAGLPTLLDQKALPITLGKGRLGQLAQQGQPWLTNQLAQSGLAANDGWLPATQMTALLFYPLWAFDRLIGAIALLARQPMPQSLLAAVQTIAPPIALAIAHHQSAQLLDNALRQLQPVDATAPNATSALDNAPPTEATLQPDGARLRALLDALPDLIFVFDRHGVYLDCLAGDEAELIVPRQQIIGMRVPEVLPPMQAQRLSAAIVQVIDHGGLELLEYELPIQGRMRHREVRVVPCGPDQALAMVRDVTNRKRAEERLLHSQELLEAMSQLAQIGAWEIDVATGTLQTSAEILRIFELPPTEPLTTERAIPFFAPEAQPVLRQAVERGLADGEPWDLELPLVTAQGTARWVRSIGRAVWRDNALFQLVGTMQDITARRQLEIEQARLLAIVERTTDFIFSFTPDGVLLYMNPAARQWFGYSAADDLTTVRLVDQYAAWAAVQLAEQALPTALREGIWSGETVIRAADGRELPGSQLLMAHYDTHGQVTYLSAIVRDSSERQQAELALRESEARFRHMADHAPVKIWVTEPSGNCTYLNQRWLNFTGTTLAENLGFGWLRSLHPEDREQTKEVFERANAHHASFVIEYRLRRWDGVYRWMIDSAAPRFADDGSFQGYIGSVLDITDRRRAEEILREREAMLRSLGDNLPNGFLYQLTTGPGETVQFTHVSAGVERTTGGLRAADILHNSNLLADQVVPEDRPRILQANREARLHQGIFDVEFRRQLPSGEIRWVHARSAPRTQLPDGTILWDGLELDITDRKLAEEALQESDRRYRALFKAANVGIALTDHHGQLLEVNEAFATMLGYTPAELVGRHFLDITHPEEREQELRLVQAVLTESVETGALWYEKRFLHRNGSAIWTRLTPQIVRDNAGQPWLMTAVVQDITEVKVLEEQIRQAQKMEAIGRLAGGLAHDFNNLLTVINGYSDLILRRLHVDDPLYTRIEQIRSAGERAASLTRQLLTFSRKQVILPALVNLNVLVSDLHKMLARLIGENIQLTTTLDPQLWPVKADPGQLEQVIMNLVINARDAMPTGGQLRITTANLHQTENDLQLYGKLPAGPYVLLMISDTGHGMDIETQRHLFEPFFTTKGPGQGTGLGLATVYGIVQQSGGGISVQSEVGQGTTFQILLPKGGALAPAQVDGPTARKPTTRGSETILLVEDDDQIRHLASTALESAGYTVLTAANGAEALQLNEQHPAPIDLLLSDVIMPGMSGPQVRERLARLRPGLKVLFVSGYTDSELSHYGVENSGFVLLPKPYTPESLQLKVREILDQSS
jgi:two-component system, cell cycle sensor histidine kinase and response regulator CckA